MMNEIEEEFKEALKDAQERIDYHSKRVGEYIWLKRFLEDAIAKLKPTETRK